ncbi:MAG: OmpA family protein [Bacteroidetes bacterium]|nr:OmpA family protein [Bacteroidota bacterium]
MRGSATAFLVVLLVWFAGSTWWYSCKIKENCITLSKSSKDISSTLIVALEGEETQTFYLKNSSNGVMEFMPGSNSNDLSIIKHYLNKNPGYNIDLYTANESQANGLLAMLILSGVPNKRINAYIDPTLGSSDKPLKITSTPNEITPAETIPPPTDSLTTDEPEEIISEELPAQEQIVPVPVNASIPGPVVNTEGGLPNISAMLYPSDSYGVRYTSKLDAFITAAKPWLSDHQNVALIITGHTDSDDRRTNNYQLALKRAVEVKKYLIKQGVPGHRIETYSKGADEPIADNSSAEGRQSNRRVIISWKY